MSQAGVLPHIHSALLPAKSKQKGSQLSSTITKSTAIKTPVMSNAKGGRKVRGGQGSVDV